MYYRRTLRLCGFLDLGFEKYIKNLVGANEHNNIKEHSPKKMMREFEFGIKRTYTGENDQPYSVALRGVKDDPANNINDETVTMKTSALRTIFNYVYRQIEELVDDQIAEVSEKRLSVKIM